MWHCHDEVQLLGSSIDFQVLSQILNVYVGGYAYIHAQACKSGERGSR